MGWKFGISKGPGFAPTSVLLVFCVLSVSETGLPSVMILRRNVVMLHAGVKIVKTYARRSLNYQVQKINVKKTDNVHISLQQRV